MKEDYFTLENIDHKSQELLEKLKNLNLVRNIKFDLKKSALLIIDMQNYFTDKNSHAFVPSSLAVIPNIKSLINFYNKANLPIIFTRHTNTQENAGLMLSRWRDFIKKEDPTSEIIPELNSYNHKIIEKTQYDAFFETELKDFLEKNNVTQLVITGVMTHLCCDSTIRSTFVNGFETFFPIDATATYNYEYHYSSFLNLSHGFTVPILSKYILNPQNE